MLKTNKFIEPYMCKIIGEISWTSPDGHTKNMIDHVFKKDKSRKEHFRKQEKIPREQLSPKWISSN